MVNIKFDMFFDRQGVQNRIEKKQEQAYSKYGAYVRTEARTSIRPAGKGGKSAKPGEPPRSHNKRLKNTILFGFDSSSNSVVIGPVPYANKAGTAGAQVLEYGGSTSINGKAAIYHAFPFMQPAKERVNQKNLKQIMGNLF